MRDAHNDTWLHTIQAAYRPIETELKVPDPGSIQPRPLLHRFTSSIALLVVTALASLALGLGL